MKTTYKRSAAKRQHLYTYVMSKLGNDPTADVTTGYRVNYGSWKRVCDAWNTDHPFDVMTVGTLSRAFIRAKTDRFCNVEVR